MKTLNVALIGDKFMGKAHSNAWKGVGHFFDIPAQPVLKVVCGRNEGELKGFAQKWGWQETETDWRKLIDRKDIDIVDVSVPTNMHMEIAVAAAQAGKHIFMEKPMCLSVEEAQKMADAVKNKKIVHYINHNYRRCPAVMLAKQLIDEGKIGTIFHWRGAYLQDWIVDPSFPLTWHLRKEVAGAGPHYDLNSHSIDLARFLVGDIKSITGIAKSFITERPLPGAGAGTFSSGSGGEKVEMGKVTVDDAAFMVVEFENGALGSFESSRFATGRKNFNNFEIYGSKGSIVFNLERMNELQYFSKDDPAYAQGFRTILATESLHAYVNAWWPPGHIIGYEHEFHHAVFDFLNAIEKGTPIAPDFNDGLKEMKILAAGLESSRTGKKIDIK